KFPDEIVGVLNSAVRTARAERRHTMRAVAHEQHTPMPKLVEALTAESVNTHPFKLELGILPEQSLHTRDDILRPPFGFRVGIPTQLEIDAPDIVRLLMQQHRLLGVEFRIEPEPALGRKIRCHAHISNQESVAERLPLRLEAKCGTNAATAAVSCDQPVAG